MGTRAGLRLAADIGGTFTDVAVFDDATGALAFGKVLSTPARLVEGITAAVRKARTDYATAGVFLHGSTIAVNTILERTGARTALVTTEGFRDVYEIGRINRPDAYNLFFRKHEPQVEAKYPLLVERFALVPDSGGAGRHRGGLGIERVVRAQTALTFNTQLFADLRSDFVRTWFTRLDAASFGELERIYREMEDAGRRAIATASVTPEEVTVQRALDMRYVGQEHAVTVDVPLELFSAQDRAGIKRQFDAMHELRYGTAAPDESAEIVSLRTTVTGVMGKPRLGKVPTGGAEAPLAALTGTRPVYLDAERGFAATPTYARQALLAGNRLEGPALVEEYASTTVLLPGDRLEVDALGNLIVTIGGRT